MHIALDHQNNERFADAIATYQQVIQQEPLNLSAYFNLGCCYLSIGKKEEAIAAFDAVLHFDPSQVSTLYNKAFCYKVFGDLETAIALYKEIIRCHPDYDPAQLALGFAYITKGDFDNGWKQHERYLKQSGKNGDAMRTLLKNNDIAYKRILLRYEGDLGDTIQFIRYAERLKNRGAYIIVLCQKPLVPLLSRCEYIDQFIIPGTTIPAYDADATLMSLPAIFGDNETTVPTYIPYIFPDPERGEYWREKLTADTNFKIGLCWQCSVQNDSNKLPIARRGYPLQSFIPLFELKNISFYSLQKCDGIEQIADLPQNCKLQIFENLDECGAFLDTAAIIKQLDLVITVDTAVAHLAGALGCEVWLLHPYATADWRWINGKADSYWYPKMRIFKQKEAFGYEEVMKKVRKELSEKESLFSDNSFLISKTLFAACYL